MVWLGGATVLACGAALLAALQGHALAAALATCVSLCGAALVIVRYEAARRALLQHQSDTESVLRCLSSGLLTVDLQERLLHWNPAAERILGLQSGELRGGTLSQVFAERAPLLYERLRRTLQDGSEIHRYEFQLTQPDGPPRPIGLSTSALHTPAGERSGILANFQDLSEVRRMQERVRRADRLAAVGQLAASIAHEVRNPLAAIANSVDMLRDELPVQGQQRKLMDLVVKESERLNRILDDFLEYASSRPLDAQVVPATTALEDVVTLLRHHPDIDAEIRIELQDRTEGGALLCIDAEQMKQVYVNLALNAFEAMQHQGTLTILVESVDGDDDGGSSVRLRFLDTGPGIDPEQADFIFEPFHTTKPEGTGLGLSIATKIVESHGGRLEGANRAGGGAEFTIDLPAVTGARAPAPGTPAALPGRERRPKPKSSEASAWSQVTEESRNVR